MSFRTAKAAVQRTGAFSQNEKDSLKNVLTVIYNDIETVEDSAGSEDVALTTPAGAGITSGTGTVYRSAVRTEDGEIPVITTRIYLDLTGLGTSTTDLDIIGNGLGVAHLGQITTAQNGVLFSGAVYCLETPATGADDIDLYFATESTGAFDAGIGTLAETIALTSGGAWTAGLVKALTGIPVADSYLYFTNGEAGTVGVYTAGILVIELKGFAV